MEVLVHWNRGTPAQQRECLGLQDSAPIPTFQPRTPAAPMQPTTPVPVQPTTPATVQPTTAAPMQSTAGLRRSQRAMVLRQVEPST